MANITKEEEKAIKRWQSKGGRCVDYVPSVQECIESKRLEVKANLRQLEHWLHFEGSNE